MYTLINIRKIQYSRAFDTVLHFDSHSLFRKKRRASTKCAHNVWFRQSLCIHRILYCSRMCDVRCVYTVYVFGRSIWSRLSAHERDGSNKYICTHIGGRTKTKTKSANRHHLMIYLYLFYIFFSASSPPHTHTRTFLWRISFCGELIYCYHLRHYGGHTIHNFVTRALDRKQKNTSTQHTHTQIICVCVAISFCCWYFFHTLEIGNSKASSYVISSHHYKSDINANIFGR